MELLPKNKWDGRCAKADDTPGKYWTWLNLDTFGTSCILLWAVLCIYPGTVSYLDLWGEEDDLL
jgi:hypothetical protein